MSGAQLPSLPCALDGSYARLNFCLPRDVSTPPTQLDIASPATCISPGGRALLRCDSSPRSRTRLWTLGRAPSRCVRGGLFIPGSDFRAVLQISFVRRLQPGSYATHSDADAFHVRKHGAFDGREAVQVSQE